MSNFPETGQTFGRYQIVGRLGRGGTGAVFRAVQTGLNRELALKVLLPQHAQQEEFHERFAREAAVLASLDSPNIVQVIDYGEHDGYLYLATQLVKDGDLGRSITENGPMPLSEALDVLAQLASALADAHAAGIIHGDVKPSNVLLRRSSQRAHAYLCDFGIAHAAGEGHTQTEAASGSAAYLAPERHSGGPASPQSDIYSLGCLLVTSVTGRPPYAGTDAEIAEAHRSSQIPQWEETSAVLTSLNKVLRRSMAKDPQERYSTAQELRRDLLAMKPQVRAPRRPVPTDATTDRSTAPRSEGVTSTYSPGRRRPKQWVIVASAAAAVVAIVGGVSWAVAAQDDPQGSRDRSGASQPAERSTPASPEPSTTTAAADVCWNGTEPSANGTCTEPDGLVGLTWVFPTIGRLGSPPCHRDFAEAAIGKQLAWTCPTKVAGGRAITITFSEWRNWKAVNDDYLSDYAGEDPQRRGGVLTYGPLEMNNGRFRASVMYADKHAFSATAIGDTANDVEKALDLIQLRTPREFKR